MEQHINLTREDVILIVDDEPITRDLLARMFQRSGYRTDWLESGSHVLARAVETNPSLIVLDYQLPDIDGFEVLQMLRDHPRTRRTPVIIITASANSPAQIAQGMDLDANDYVLKPFDMNELVSRVVNRLRSHHFEQELEKRNRRLETLLRVGSAFNQSLESVDSDALCRVILESVVDQFECQYAVVTLYSDNSHYAVEHRYGLPDDTLTDDDSPENTITALALDHSDDAILIHDSNRPINNLKIKIFAGTDARSGMAAAITHQGTLFGSITVGSDRIGAFTVADMRVLRSIGEQAALALHNADLQRQLARYVENLEQSVEERTQALQATQTRLAEAQRMAALGTLAAGVAHEIRNPLQPILSNLELALEDLAANRPVEHELLTNSVNEVRRIERTVMSLLDYTRESPGERRIVKLDQVVNDSVVFMRTQLKHLRIKVVDRLNAEVPILANADELKQVLLNLMVNARDAMPLGGTLQVRTTVEQDADDRQVAKLVIEDSGSGIPTDVLPRIFEPFYTTKGGAGSGLGLAITYSVIRAHEGTITVESEVGKFTRFILSLPVAEM